MAGTISADGAGVRDAGSLSVTAGGNIILADGADLSADANDTGDAGDIFIMADDTSQLNTGARVSADANGSGDAGFVEFSARGTVELAGGKLSASAVSGANGEILIDPENIIISSDLLRDTSNDGGTSDGGGTSWNAGSLTLEADNNITISANRTVSSRVVNNSADAAAHRNDLSTGDSGDITFTAQTITLEDNAMVTAAGDNGQQAGDVAFTATSGETAAISLDNADVRGGNVALTATATQEPVSNYDNPQADVAATVTITNGSQIASSANTTITTSATQAEPDTGAGVIVAFDARTARSTVTIDDSSISAGGAVTVAGTSEVRTDLSRSGWAGMASLLPADVAVAVTTSESDVNLTGTTSITATGDATIQSTANTRSTVYAQSNSVGASFVAGVSMTDNAATVDITETVSVNAQNITAETNTRSQITAVGDASAGTVGGASGALAASVGVLNNKSKTTITDSSNLNASGNIDITADSEVSSLFAARATQDSDFNQTVQDKFDAGVDSTSELNVDFMGFNVGDFLKTTVGGFMTTFEDSMSSPDASDETVFQLGGALVFGKVTNDTEAVVASALSDTVGTGPTLTSAGTTNIEAQGTTQSQSFASGRTNNPNYGGQAGIAIQIVDTSLKATIGGGGTTTNINATDLNLLAQTISDSASTRDQNSMGVFASSGLGGGGSDGSGVGVAGAIAIGINETNDTLATIGSNAALALGGDVTVDATNTTEVKVKADGSDNAHEAADELFAVMVGDDSLEIAEDPEVGGGLVGVGASVAVATNNNITKAIIDGDANFSGATPSSISVTANQTSETEAEGRAAGVGSISIVPLAAVTLARNQAEASILSGTNAINTSGAVTIRSTQSTETSAVGIGAANGTGDDSRFALGITAGVTVSLDSSLASLDRDLTTSNGALTLESLSHQAIQSGATAASSLAPAEDENGEPEAAEEPGEDNPNSTEDAIGGLASLVDGFTDYDMSALSLEDKLSADTDTLGGGADLGGIGGDGEDEDSTSLTIAAALGVTYADTSSTAEVGQGAVVNTGTGAIRVASQKNTDVSADADASADGGSINLGGAVGLNIVRNRNLATVQSNADITAGDLAVVAEMLDVAVDENTNEAENKITSETVAGAGTGEFSLAGSVGLNLVLQNQTEAKLASNSTIAASGNVSVTSESINKYNTDARATVGMSKTIWQGIDETFSTLTDIDVWTGALEEGFDGMLTNLQASLQDGGSSDDGSGDGSGDGSDGEEEGGTGIGAGIALNIIIDETTRAAIDDNASLTGTSAGVTVNAVSQSQMTTAAFAGAKPDEAGGAAKTSLDAAVAVGVMIKDVDA